jgi:hypothetical protein
MIEGDIEAILIFLRNTSFGSDMEIMAVDPKTNNRFKVNVSLEELTIINGLSPNSEGMYEIVLPKSGDTIKLKPLTYGEILQINDIIESYPQGRTAPRVTLRLSKEIISINGSTDKAYIAKYVEGMPIADSKFIKKFLNDNEPKLDLKRDIMTPSGDMTTVYAGFGVEFFRPFFGI